MPERGGPATQSGILYQNAIAALYLGRLCDATERPEADQVVRVRVEAPEEVDDIVVSYADGHTAYMQVKERLAIGDAAWRELWSNFAAQYQRSTFARTRDRLLLHMGDAHRDYRALGELCERARASCDATEWLGRLTDRQLELLDAVGAAVGTTLPGGNDVLHGILRHTELEAWPLVHVERDLVPHWMPATSVAAHTLFRLLRDRVGGQARVRGTFEAALLRASLRADDQVEFSAAPGLEALRVAVRACSAVLRQHKATLGGTGIHVPRAVAAEIAVWAGTPQADQPVGLLLDHAGRGKTVIMRDVLLALEAEGVAVLAVKADLQLAECGSAADLQRRLGFTEPVERVIARLAATGPVVVLIDQIDALSLSLARDQQAMNIVLELVARLRVIPAVTVLLSCRTFDRHTDPRLKRIEVGREFPLPLLEHEEVASLLAFLGVASETLAPATRELLRTPLHLDLFASLVRAPDREPARLRGIVSLQELYALLWDDVVRRTDPLGPSVADREAALHAVTARMHRDQHTWVPRSVVDALESPTTTRAADWLASAGILVPSATGWTFLHQTFFDYCYARFFVEGGGDLGQVVRASDQGLFIRSQIVQVLAYLRGTGHPQYLRTLNSLLGDTTLRFHLHDLVLRWLGALQDPSETEWILLQRLLAYPELRTRALRAITGSATWFPRLAAGPLEGLLGGAAAAVDNEVLPYLASLVDGEDTQGPIAALAQAWLTREDPWPTRAHWMARLIRKWQTPEAVALYEQVLGSLPLSSLDHTFQLDDVAEADPVAGCRLLRLLLDRVLDAYATEPDGTRRVMRGLNDALDALDGYTVRKALGVVVAAAPREFLDTMLPWLERAVAANGPAKEARGGEYHTSDPLASIWVDRSGVRDALLGAYARALRSVAECDRDAFRTHAHRLAASPYVTPQQIVAMVYRDTMPAFAGDALRFLLADPRRLRLGEDDALLTRQLLAAAAPHLDARELAVVEQLILTATDRVRPWHQGRGALQWRGIDQLHLLRAFPRSLLSREGRSRLDELERKFPDVETRNEPNRERGGVVGPPIPTASVLRMSDNAWLRAMAKYAHGVEHPAFLRGGAMQLARELQALVKVDPRRFVALAARTPPDLDDQYAEAFIAGLSESECPAEWVYDVVRQFATSERPGIRRQVAWALHKALARADRLPPDLLALLEGWARGDPGDDEAWYDTQQQDLSHAAINTDRGVALLTLLAALAAENGDHAVQRRWELLEFAARDSSLILRAAGMDALALMLSLDRDRSITLFEEMVRNQPRLRHAHAFQRFLYYASYGRFGQIGPYIREMMHAGQTETQQRGAELAVLGHLATRGLENTEAIALAESLIQEAMSGPPEWRRGAARIYAHNLAEHPGDQCEAGLRRLLDDPDVDVRREVAWMVHRLRPEHVLTRQEFLSAFVASWSVRSALHEFAEYLWENGLLDPAWALRTVQTLLSNGHPDDERSAFAGGEHLVRLVLRVYTDPMADAQLRERAMTVFDGLMERFSADALAALTEWDRG